MTCRSEGSTLRLKLPKHDLNPDLSALIKVKIISDSCTVTDMWWALCGSTYSLFSELTRAKPHYELWVKVSAHIAFYCWLPCTDGNLICTLLISRKQAKFRIVIIFCSDLHSIANMLNFKKKLTHTDQSTITLNLNVGTVHVEFGPNPSGISSAFFTFITVSWALNNLKV